MPVERARTREEHCKEQYAFSVGFSARSVGVVIREADDRMYFPLRRRLPLPQGRVLATRRPHSLGRSLLSARQTSSQSTLESTHVATGSFPPLPNDLPEPPPYPCPHLTDFDASGPLYKRHWRVRASHNNARDVKTVALEKKFTLTKYRHTLEFFNYVMGLQGVCAQEKVSPSHITRDNGIDETACLASSNRCPVHIHDIDFHAKDLKRRPCRVTAGYPAIPRDNPKGYSLGYPYREAL